MRHLVRDNARREWRAAITELVKAGRPEKALKLFDEVRPYFRQSAGFAAENADVAVYAGRLDVAEREYSQAVTLGGDTPELRIRRAAVRLQTGDWVRGWKDYESRLQIAGVARFEGLRRAVSKAPVPPWRAGEPSPRRLLVFGEQGIGDTVQFLRFPLALSRQGVEVTLVERELFRPLVEEMGGDIKFRGLEESLSSDLGDGWAYLMSLPHLMGVTFPGAVAFPPYLGSGRSRSGLVERVGLCWQGNPRHRNDARRSAPLQAFSSVLEGRFAEVVSLQVGHGAEQISSGGWDARVRTPWRNGVSPEGLEETIAVIEDLDAVVTVDTAIAHIAGAIGKRTCLLLPSLGADWRWLQDRSDTPWYPDMTLFRQGREEAWSDSVLRAANALL